MGAEICRRALIADHRVAAGDGSTRVERSFLSKGLVANVVGSLFSRMIRDYVATEARTLKKHCDDLAPKGETVVIAS